MTARAITNQKYTGAMRLNPLSWLLTLLETETQGDCTEARLNEIAVKKAPVLHCVNAIIEHNLQQCQVMLHSPPLPTLFTQKL